MYLQCSMEVRSEATLLLGPIPSERPMGPSVISRRSSLPPSPTPDFSFSPSQLAGGCHSCHTV